MPVEAQFGNTICIFKGVEVPFVSRLVGERDGVGEPRYELVGWSYVHGIMMGELVKVLDAAGL